MEQLLAHLVGDFVLQNQWMANRKTASWAIAFLHAAFYTSLFVVFFWGQWAALAIIFVTHAIIDHYRLSKYWMRFWGVGEPGILWPNAGKAPDFIAVWLLFITDNTMHLLINWAALRWLPA